MFDLVFLGTSASTPSAFRGLSAQMLMHRQHRFLIDCGEGTQRQILRSGLGFKRLDKVLLTHSHLDHIMGLGGLVSTLARWDVEVMETFEIYGGRATLERVADLVFGVALRGNKTPVEIKLMEVRPHQPFFQDKQLTVTPFPVQHRGPGCFGYLFEEPSRRPFLDEKANELGVPFGPDRGELVRGNPITLEDGTVIKPEQVLGDPIKGAKLVNIGDVGRVDTLIDICQDADALVIESTYTETEADMAKRFGHLTAAQAANLAKEANVKSLILTHISRRHPERDVREEAQAIFPNTTVARDFDHFQITQDGATRIGGIRFEAHPQGSYKNE